MRHSLSLFFFFIGTVLVNADCPSNWIRHEESCYLFVNHHATDWNGAMFFCANLGSKLVEIETRSEDTFLNAHAHDLGRDQKPFWIGGSDILLEGEWMWMTSKTIIDYRTYTNWHPGQPSNSGGNENCLDLVPPTFLWNDNTCSKQEHFICEKLAGDPVVG